MIGWDSTAARDAAEAITNGRMDEDLEHLRGEINIRIAMRDGEMVTCPQCSEPIKRGFTHDHPPLRIVHIEA